MKGRSISFRRHYNIPPPGVKARFTIFAFSLYFLYRPGVGGVYALRFYAAFYVYLCVICTFWGCFRLIFIWEEFCVGKGVGFSTVRPPPGSPLSLAALRASRQLPRGGSQVHARAYEENLVVRRSFSGLFLTTKLAGFDAGTLGSPRGGAGTGCASAL